MFNDAELTQTVKIGQALHKENSDLTTFNEAELKQYFDYPTKFKKIKLFSQKKYK